MLMLADYRLVEQGGLFFRQNKRNKLLPDMRGAALSSRDTVADFAPNSVEIGSDSSGYSLID